MNRFSVGLAFGILVVLAAAARGQDAAPQAAAKGFGGAWESTFGRLVLTQTGSRVAGSYSGATLSGRVKGKRLTFRYTEPDAKGEGWFELAGDGASFAGMWREDGGRWSEWTGKRIAVLGPRGPFDGLFETPLGRVRLIQPAGGGIRGTYAYGGVAGTLAGTVSGRTFAFEWKESAATGLGRFTLSADGRSFEGTWRIGKDGEEKPWNGTRVQPRPKVVWLMVLEAQWEQSLADQEYSFGAMLRAFFRRYPHVQVRQRRFGDRPDFLRAASELTLLAEPVVLVVASHGESGKLVAGNDRIDPKDLGNLLNDAPNVKALHFSSCEMMLGEVPEGIQSCLKGRRIPLSGYAVTVDWSASAILEFLYLDLVLGRGLKPSKAAAIVRSELRFASDTDTLGSPLGGSHFRFVE
jgi:hypothetical protein